MSKAAELAKWGEVSTNGQVSGRRNIVINGAMNVAQRSASVTGLGGNQTYSTVDRFRQNTANTAGRFTMTQTADGPSGFANCMKLDCTTADTSIAAGEVGIIQYKIEGQDVQQIKKGTSDAEKVNVSFYVKGNANATYVCELEDVDNSRINTQAFNVTTSWTRVVLTFAADTTGALDDDNAESLALNIWLHAGSTYSGGTFSSNTWASKTNANRAAGITSFFDSTDRTFFLTGVQLEVGSVATPFEHRSYGEELALCQRYYNKIGDGSIVSNSPLCVVASYNTSVIYGVYYFPQQMRANPTLEYVNGGGYYTYLRNGTNDPFDELEIEAVNTSNIEFHVDSGLGGSSHIAGHAGWIRVNNASAYVALTAELQRLDNDKHSKEKNKSNNK